MQAARRLAITLGAASLPNAPSADPHIRRLEQAVAAYVAESGLDRNGEALAGEVADVVRFELWADELVAHPEPLVRLVAGIAQHAVLDVIPA